MDPRIRRFRQRSQELNRGRSPQGRRYGEELRRLAVAIVSDHRHRGGTLENAARALNLAPTVLCRWQKIAASRPARLRPVLALEAQEPTATATPGLVLVTRQGYRLEGLGVAEAIHVLRALS